MDINSIRKRLNQLQNPDLSDRAKSNRQKKLDKLQSIYGEEV